MTPGWPLRRPGDLGGTGIIVAGEVFCVVSTKYGGTPNTLDRGQLSLPAGGNF